MQSSWSVSLALQAVCWQTAGSSNQKAVEGLGNWEGKRCYYRPITSTEPPLNLPQINIAILFFDSR